MSLATRQRGGNIKLKVSTLKEEEEDGERKKDISYEGDLSANSTPPKNVENIEIVKTASRPVWHPGGCIGASNGASTALKLPGKPEIHVFFVRLYMYSGP